MYQPYSPEWHRYRYLKEARDLYFDNYVDNNLILNDIHSIIGSRSEAAYSEFNRLTDLESKLKD